MDFMRFVIAVGVATLVLSFLMKLISIVVVIVAAAIFRTNWRVAFYVNRAILVYLAAAIVGLMALHAFQMDPSFSIVYGGLGAVALFAQVAGGLCDSRRQAIQRADSEMLEATAYDSLFAIGSVLLYFVMLRVPDLAKNGATDAIFGVVGWASSVPVLGWLLAIGGLFFLIHLLIMGVGVLVGIASLLKSSGGSDSGSAKHG